ncbi:hypothetical protein TIFTF001_016993 [Ficus carica]|uniref:Transmembrane protein n=1 Tax=Ficus carica TaxID=3494 RepID=A0AA88DAB8_FICCA|nr:hypothetical protein TIFTF001_016993 [Ficus carica]
MGDFIGADLMSLRGWFLDGLEAFCDVFLVWWLYSFGILFQTVVSFLWRHLIDFAACPSYSDDPLVCCTFIDDLGLGELEVPLAMSLNGDVCGLWATCYMLSMD